MCYPFRYLILIAILFFGHHLQAQNIPSDLHGIRQLPPFERAVLIIKFYEGWHTRKDYPYIGYGHKIQKGERLHYPISKAKGETIIRNDLQKLCAKFREYGADSLLLVFVSYICGPVRILGKWKKIPKSRLIQKLDDGNREILTDYLFSVAIMAEPSKASEGKDGWNSNCFTCY